MTKSVFKCFMVMIFVISSKGNYEEYSNYPSYPYGNYPSFDDDATNHIPPPLNECVLDSLDSLRIIDIESSFKFSEEEKKLNAILTWNISSRFHEEVEFDGFLVNFTPSNNLEKSINPKNLCNTENQYWIFTTDPSECSTDTTICKDQVQSNSYCISKTPESSVGEENCTHWNEHGTYFSIPKTIRNLTFTIDFLQEYHFSIVPYYRQYISPNYVYAINHVIYAPTCLEHVMMTSHPNRHEAAEFCCGLNLTEIDVSKVRNITVGDFRVDPALKIVNLTATWLPPNVPGQVLSFSLTTIDFGDYMLTRNSFVDNPFWNRVQRLRIPAHDSEDARSVFTPEYSCDTTEFYYKVVLSDLKPGKTYNVMITTNFDSLTYSSRCKNGNCVSFKEFTVPEINVCDFNYCDKNSNCTPDDVTGVTSLHATCVCNDGFEGNGVNPTTDSLGNGCVDQDDCRYADDFCSEVSECVDNKAPSTGVQCSCPSGHYGDGYKDGSGCRPVYELALKISVPLIFFFTLVFTALVCKLKYRHDKKTRKTSTNKISSRKKIFLNVIFTRP